MSEVQTYPIEGRTTEELRAAIIDASRTLGSVSHGAASASFKFMPALSYEEVGDGCVLSDNAVRLDAKILLPEWVSSRGADEETVGAWRRFKRYLEAHEARHASIASDYRSIMAKELAAIGVMADCPTVGREAVAVVAEVERQHDEAQSAFDHKERDRSSLLGR